MMRLTRSIGRSAVAAVLVALGVLAPRAPAIAVLAQSFVDTNTLPEKPDIAKLHSEKFLPGAK